MKKIAFLTVFTLSTAVAIFAQADRGERERMTAEERAKKITEKMKTEFKLSDEQTRKIAAVNLDKAKKTDALREENKSHREEMKDKLQAIHEEREQEYKKIFTSEQFAAYTKKKEARKEKMMHRLEKKKKQIEKKMKEAEE